MASMGWLTLMSDAFIHMTWWCSSSYSFFAISKLYWASRFCSVAGSKSQAWRPSSGTVTSAALLHRYSSARQATSPPLHGACKQLVTSRRPACRAVHLWFSVVWWVLRCRSAA